MAHIATKLDTAPIRFRYNEAADGFIYTAGKNVFLNFLFHNPYIKYTSSLKITFIMQTLHLREISFKLSTLFKFQISVISSLIVIC